MPDLETRIRQLLTERGEVTVRRVLSGVGYFLNGSMAAAVIDGCLCVTVDVDEWEMLLAGTGVRSLQFADRPVPGWVLVEPSTIEDDHGLISWIDRGLCIE
jgi:TfoX/Sxy family transcriptional regulator of competence genes